MTLTIIIILFLIGFALLLIELLLTPGIIVGTFGVLCMIAGIYMTWQTYGNVAGALVLLATIVGSIAMVVVALKSGVWDRMANHDTIAGRMNEIPVERLKTGDRGTTLSVLRPSGNAFIGGMKLEVSTEGEIVEAHCEVEIIKINHNRIIVKQIG